MTAGLKMNVQVDGLTELVRQLEDLGRKRGKIVVRKMVNKASTIYVKDARRRAPRGKTGNLRSGLVKRIKSYNGGAFILAVMGNKVGHGGAQHAHLVEAGTKQRFWTGRRARKRGQISATKGKSTGIMPANPFMRPAFDATRGQMMSKMVEVGRVELAKEAARGAKK